MPRAVRPIAAIATLAIGFSLSAAAYMAFGSGTDALLDRSYGQAFADTDTTWDGAGPAGPLWLSSLGDGPAGGTVRLNLDEPMLRKSLAIGDRITVTGGSAARGADRADIIVVTGIEQIDGDAFGIPGLRIQVVTGRPIGGDPTAAPDATVRFLFAVSPAPQPREPQPAAGKDL